MLRFMEKLESLVPVVVAQSKKLFKTKGRHISVATAKEDSQTDVLTKLQHEALWKKSLVIRLASGRELLADSSLRPGHLNLLN